MGNPSKRLSSLWLALIVAAWGLIVLVTGGVSWEIGALHISSRNAVRPLLLAGVFIVWHLFRHGPAATLSDAATVGRRVWRPRVLAGGAAAITFLIGIVYGTYAVGGADSYGYLSQAELWLHGNLRVEQAFVGEFPWPNASFTMTPLGHIPTGQAGDYVPVYPPGFPVTLALFMAVGGEAFAFLVVPLLAGLAVWLTYRLGHIVWNESTGVVAALLLLASPAFLFMLMSGLMSDIPAMTWWLLAAVGAAGHEKRRWHLIVSGLAVSMAILTRPNLAPLAALLPFLIALGEPTWTSAARRVGMWLAPALVGPLALAIVNNMLYGSPTQSGYGEVSTMFALSHFWPNVQRYSGWLLDSQTPFVFCGLVAPVVMWRTAANRTSVALVWWCLAFTAAIVTAYLWYTVFGAWWFLRFLLPAYPMMLVAAATSAVLVASKSRTFGLPALVLVTALLFAHGFRFAHDELLFRMGDGEYRYKEAGERAGSLPPNAVVIAMLHSGSVRHYGKVLTLRYDFMPPLWLDRAVEYLSDRGHPVYAFLDGSEVEQVRKRFSANADLSWLSRSPIEITSRRVLIYEVAKARK